MVEEYVEGEEEEHSAWAQPLLMQIARDIKMNSGSLRKRKNATDENANFISGVCNQICHAGFT